MAWCILNIAFRILKFCLTICYQTPGSYWFSITFIASYRQRQACLQKQQSSITVYHLPNKGNKRPPPLFYFYLQQTNTSLLFTCLFSENKRKLPFFYSSLFCLRNSGNVETWKHGDMETWRHGDMETWGHGYMDT
jgi:hypothetical protein